MFKKYFSLFLFMLVPLLAGSIIGIATAPGAWYAELAKPWFNPPNWIFAPVWSALYLLIGIAGWLIWRRDRTSGAMVLWLSQMLLNWLWSPIFFTFHAIAAAFFVIGILLATIVTFIFVAWRIDKAAAISFVPYGLWVGFATLLNAWLWRLN